MNIFLDCEFTGLTKDASLISLALYADDDTYFYAEFNDVDYNKVSPWIKENVLVHLEFKELPHIHSFNNRMVKIKGNTKEIKEALMKWINEFDTIEIWADMPHYDWVFFCELFGGALKIPKNIFYIPFDLATLFKVRQINPDFNRFEFVSSLLAPDEKKMQHHALMDAKVGKLCYEKIM